MDLSGGAIRAKVWGLGGWLGLEFRLGFELSVEPGTGIVGGAPERLLPGKLTELGCGESGKGVSELVGVTVRSSVELWGSSSIESFFSSEGISFGTWKLPSDIFIYFERSTENDLKTGKFSFHTCSFSFSVFDRSNN